MLPPEPARRLIDVCNIIIIKCSTTIIFMLSIIHSRRYAPVLNYRQHENSCGVLKDYLVNEILIKNINKMEITLYIYITILFS